MSSSNERLAEMNKVFAALDRLGPEAYNAVMAAARTEALTSLFWGVVLLSLAVVFFGWAWYARRRYRLAPQTFTGSSSAEGWGVIALVAACSGVLALLGSLPKLLDPWVWATLQRPELWVARQLLGLGQ